MFKVRLKISFIAKFLSEHLVIFKILPPEMLIFVKFITRKFIYYIMQRHFSHIQ